MFDIQIDCIRSVLQQRCNENTAFVAAFRAAIGLEEIFPVNATFACDPSPRASSDGWDAVAAGNANYPALFVWRSDCNWEGETWDTDTNSAKCQMKYVLPADPGTEVAFALLHGVTREFRRILQEAGRRNGVYADQDTSPTSKYESDYAKFRAAGFNTWAYQMDVRYRYEGPQGQALYPIAHVLFDFKHSTRQDTSVLPLFTSFEAGLHIVGKDQDGDAPPAINPLVSSLYP